MRNFLIAALLLLLPASASALDGDFGLLIMAHGGTPHWNAHVRAAVAPLAAEVPAEIAFGMADADSLQEAVAALEARGVTRIGVVRLFIDGGSFLERTEKILGLRHGAPPPGQRQESPMPGLRMATYRIETNATFAMAHEGLIDAEETEAILLDRVRDLSVAPSQEVLVLIAHGAGTEETNARLQRLMLERAQGVMQELQLRDVKVHTLAEDWSDLRPKNETAIRNSLTVARAEGLMPVVVPFRLAGFGPYAEVLEGLEYRSNELGLLPHDAITDWIRRQAGALEGAAFLSPGEASDVDVTMSESAPH